MNYNNTAEAETLQGRNRKENAIIEKSAGHRGWCRIRISVIVPALNEEKVLGRTLSSLKLSESEELIVVDGGSTDRTFELARGFTKKVLSSAKGRGSQMNTGARAASGDALLFLHADSVLPEEGFSLIRNALSGHGVSGGAFDLSIEKEGACFRIIEFGANLRSRMTSIPYGDQGVFLKKEVFERLGGFKDMPLMEDVEFSMRLKKAGRMIFLRPPIKTSPRRWLKEGPLYTTLRDWTLVVSYAFLGIRPGRLVKHYRDVR